LPAEIAYRGRGHGYYWWKSLWVRVKVAALFSGGKDSTYALYVAQQRGWDVCSLVTIVPEDTESLLYHVPNIHLAPLLSECIGIPLTLGRACAGESGEVGGMEDALRDLAVDGIVTGAVASEYQKSRIDGVCQNLGLRCFSPLWRRNQAGLLDDYIAAGFRIIFSGVSAEGLDSSWLGRELNQEAKEELLSLHGKHGLSPCGEGGEYESLVLDGPNFMKRLRIEQSESQWKGKSGTFRILKAVTEEKR